MFLVFLKVHRPPLRCWSFPLSEWKWASCANLINWGTRIFWIDLSLTAADLPAATKIEPPGWWWSWWSSSDDHYVSLSWQQCHRHFEVNWGHQWGHMPHQATPHPETPMIYGWLRFLGLKITMGRKGGTHKKGICRKGQFILLHRFTPTNYFFGWKLTRKIHVPIVVPQTRQ